MASLNDNIISHSIASSPISHDYSFYPSALLEVNGTVVGKVGELDYENPLFEITHGVRLGDFFFSLEKRTKLGIELTAPLMIEGKKVVGAFRGRMHYQFDHLDDNEDLEENYMNYLIKTFVPILYPNLNVENYSYNLKAL